MKYSLSSYFFCSALLLTGCATRTQIVEVPIEIRCQVAAPQRPEMPTENLQPGIKLHQFSRAAIAEILRREAYEIELVAALGKCNDK